MKTWPDRNGNAIGRFVQQHRLYHPSTLAIYRSVLHGFQDAVDRRERSSSGSALQVIATSHTAELAEANSADDACTWAPECHILATKILSFRRSL